MGLSQDGPISPSQQVNPQDSPPMASRHSTRAPTRTEKFDEQHVHSGLCFGEPGGRATRSEAHVARNAPPNRTAPNPSEVERDHPS